MKNSIKCFVSGLSIFLLILHIQSCNEAGVDTYQHNQNNKEFIENSKLFDSLNSQLVVGKFAVDSLKWYKQRIVAIGNGAIQQLSLDSTYRWEEKKKMIESISSFLSTYSDCGSNLSNMLYRSYGDVVRIKSSKQTALSLRKIKDDCFVFEAIIENALITFE